MTQPDLRMEALVANALRVLAMDAVQRGHGYRALAPLYAL